MTTLGNREFNALAWVKSALDETLAHARRDLAAYVENPERDDSLRTCLVHLHEVQGSLRMVELYGAAMVVETMERLVEGLLDNSVRQRDEAYSVLMRGMVQLPDYLERLQGGYKDIPIVLLPLLNDLRASRGEALLSESSLFAPDLDAPLPAAADGALATLAPDDLRAQAMRARLGFQAALLKWFRDTGNRDQLKRLIEVLDQLRAISHGAPARRLWWIAGGFVESLVNGGVEASSAIKLLLGRVDREIHRLAHAGEAAFTAAPPRELERNLLYYIANSSSHAVRGAEILRVYRLDSLLATESELAHAQGSMTGHNRQLLDTVAVAIKDDLLRVKEALDIFLRGHGSQPAELEPQAAALDRVGDTLGMLGLGVPRRVVGEQRKIIAAMAERQRPIEEGALLDVASALLYVEASLDDHIERLGASGVGDAADEMLSGHDLPGHELPQAEMRKIQGSAMDEAMANLRQCKQDIVAFVESPWNHDRVEAIPRLFAEVAGALRMLELASAGALMDALASFVEIELITHRRVPTPKQMDMLADALAAIEYYLEAARDQRHHRERVLDVAKSSLAGLGYWQLDDAQATPAGPTATDVAPRVAAAADSIMPLPVSVDDVSPSHATQPPLAADSDEPGAAGIAAQVDDEQATHAEADFAFAPVPPIDEMASSAAPPASIDADGEWIEVEEEVDEPAYDAAAPLPGFEATDSDDIDDGIREIFLEEVGDELASMREKLPEWRERPQSLDAVRTLRRSFHTLKGSGRLVGARTLGEMSWSVEQLLNRVLDGSVDAQTAVIDLVAHAVAAVAPLYAALRGEHASGVDVASIAATAERLANGEQASVGDVAATRRVLRTVRRRVVVDPAVTSATAEQSAAPADDDDDDGSADITATIAPLDDSASPFDDAANAEALPADAAAQPIEIDPVLLEILQTEVVTHLSTIDAFLAEYANTPQAPSESVLRAVHTLNGAMGMVEIAPVADALAPLEGYVKRLRGVAEPPAEAGIAALRAAVELTRETMRRIAGNIAALPDSTALAARIAALRDALPDVSRPLQLYGIDDETATDEVQAVAADGVNEAQPRAAISSDETGEWLRETAVRVDTAEPTGHGAAEIPNELIESLARFDVADSEQAAALAPTDTSDDAIAMHADGLREISFTGRPPRGDEASLAAAAPEADVIGASHERPAAVEIDDAAPVGDVGATRDAEHDEESTIDVDDDVSARSFVTAGNEILIPRAAAQADEAAAAGESIVVPAATTLSGPAAAPLAADDVVEGALDAGDVDDDLLDIFVQEAADILDSADGLVAGLRRSPDDRTPIAGLQRELHTLKGGARMAGLAAIGDLSHAMESLVDALAEGRREVDRASVEVMESAFDRLQKLVQRVAARRAIAMPEQTIRYLADFVAGTDTLTAEPTQLDREAIGSDDTAAAVSAASEAHSASAAASAAKPLPRAFAQMHNEPALNAPQEMIRVRSDLLDALANHAGEVSIYRSRLEQQISTFRFNLVEFESTVARLRDQLRKLEIETEAQIIARYQREHQGASGPFDPLELDRFSQLQQLSRALGESVSDLVSIQGLLDEQTRQSETLLQQQQRVSSELQEGLMQTRMVPFESMVPNLRRTLRQAAQEVGKQAQLTVAGAQGEMDRNLLERMKAPFEHMLRNALAHGIESVDERRAAGKPDEGQVGIALSREATEVVLRVRDDGRGMDRDAIRAKAIERGLLKADNALTDDDLFAFVLESGFSTAGEVTQLAGRGVGMDVVANEIKQLGGSLAIDSTAGQGTRFTIRLPFTLAVTQAILVSLGGTSYAIPMTSVLGVVRVAREDLDQRLQGGDPRHDYGGEVFLIRDLAQLLGVARAPSSHDEQVPLLMTRSGEQRIAVRVDSVIGSREIVVKAVGPQVSSVPGVFGATITGDGAVVVILDLPPLVRRLAALRERIDAGIVTEPEYLAPQPAFEPVVRSKPLVMVVDDSITMRKVTTRVLERADLDVVTAKDGLDALEKLQTEVPDLMLLDIEMPRMDGYELATYMRNDARMRQVPIIMITSRTGEKHRQRALEIGVEHYLGKPYQEDELMRHVLDMLAARHVSEQTTDARIALLNGEGVTVPHVRAALESLGMYVVHEATCTEFDRAALDASGANVVIVNLGATANDIDDGIYELLADARYRVIFNEADVSGALSGWDQTRWARHLAAKIAGDDDIDPPRPANAEAVPELHARADAPAAADIGATHADIAEDGVANLGGIDELLSHFDAAIGAAEQRERDASTASDVVNVAESAAAHAAIDVPVEAAGDHRGAQASDAAELKQGFALAIADEDAPLAAPATPAPEAMPSASLRPSDNWSLESFDDAPATPPISGKASYVARDVASENERIAGSMALPPAAAAASAPVSPAEAWLTSLQLEPMEADASPRVASPRDESEVVGSDAAAAETPRDRVDNEAIGALWMVVASSDAGHAVAEFLGALTNPVNALVVIADQRSGGAQDTPATWTRSIPFVPRTPQDGERVAIGDVVIAPTPALLHVATDGRVTIEPADDSFPYRSPLDRTLCHAADAFGNALSAIVLDGAPADVLPACHHVVECGGRVYAQDAASCGEPATSAAIASGNIASAIAPVQQIAAMLVAGSGR